MKKSIFTFLLLVSITALAWAQEPIANKTMKPEQTEFYTPVPPVVTPSGPLTTPPPSDAIVLFNGKNLDNWVNMRNGKPAGWTVANGAMTVNPKVGDIVTKQKFEDFQLHIEWRTPTPAKGEGQGRGNSGVYLQSLYEVQVLDSYHSKTYVNGQAGAIYKQYPPLVNACLPPGKWQSYDIIFHAPRFNYDGTVKTPAIVTVFQNGVLIQNHVKLFGRTLYIGHPYYQFHGPMPLRLQDHGNLVSYRNIWIRELK